MFQKKVKTPRRQGKAKRKTEPARRADRLDQGGVNAEEAEPNSIARRDSFPGARCEFDFAPRCGAQRPSAPACGRTIWVKAGSARKKQSRTQWQGVTARLARLASSAPRRAAEPRQHSAPADRRAHVSSGLFLSWTRWRRGCAARCGQNEKPGLVKHAASPEVWKSRNQGRRKLSRIRTMATRDGLRGTRWELGQRIRQTAGGRRCAPEYRLSLSGVETVLLGEKFHLHENRAEVNEDLLRVLDELHFLRRAPPREG